MSTSGSRTTEMRLLIIGALLAGELAFSRPVAAAPTPESPDALIDRGLNLRRRGKPADALELFERANSLAPSARALAQMGLAEISLHRWIDADAHIGAALSRHDSDWIENPKTREALQQALGEVGRHLGHLRFEGTDGAEITIAGKVIGRLPMPASVAIEPGVIRIHAAAPGHQSAEFNATTAAGEEIVAKAELVPIPIVPLPATPVVPGPLPERPRWIPWTGTALVGTGVAAGALGIAWLAINGNGTCDPAPGGTCQRNYDTRLQGWLAVGAGAVLVGAGVGILFWRGHHERISLRLGPSSFAAAATF
jgi:hypothetical protein